MLVELCVGGGGRFTAIGPISLRMILFSVALVMSIPLLIKKKSFPCPFWILSIAFVLMILVGTLVGWANHNSNELIYQDVKPLCYFFVLPFFYQVIDEAMILNTIRIIKTASISMAAVFIALLVLIHSGIIPFPAFYRATMIFEELFYRGEVTFFYKGFLFFGIGAIFFYFTERSGSKKYFFFLLVTAIMLSVTRGLLLSLVLSLSVYFLVIKTYWRAAVVVLFAVTIVVWGSDFILSASRLVDAKQNNKGYHEADPTLLGDRDYSDNGRVTQAKEVWRKVSFSSAIMGHGFGAGTPSRPIHMEISYLEIFHKQGLIGLIFWGLLASMIFIQYRQAVPSPATNGFVYSSLFIFIESLTNQYINNPIGMSLLLLSLVCLYKLKMKK